MSAADSSSEPGSGATCRNCGAHVDGRFCSACGQEVRRADRVSDLVAEWFQRLFSERVLWGTLKLLVLNPGRLTQEWWTGRRAGLMSPVRTLFTVLLFASVVAFGWQALSGKATELSSILMRATYIGALAMGLVSIRILPGLLPKAARRTAYEYATAGLYECAFMGLMTLAAVTLLLIGGLIPWLGAVASFAAPFVLPLMGLAVFAHAIAHLRGAFGLSLPGALARGIALGAAFAVAMALIAMLFQISGVDRLWTPEPTEMGAFQRV